MTSDVALPVKPPGGMVADSVQFLASPGQVFLAPAGARLGDPEGWVEVGTVDDGITLDREPLPPDWLPCLDWATVKAVLAVPAPAARRLCRLVGLHRSWGPPALRVDGATYRRRRRARLRRRR